MSGGKFSYLDRRPEAPAGAYEEVMEEMGGRWMEFQSLLQIIAGKKKEAEELHQQVAPVIRAIENWASGDWTEEHVDEAIKELWKNHKKPSS